MPAVSLLVLAVLAQPLQHRVQVLGRGGEVFWATGAGPDDLWERVRGDVQLDARRSPEGATSAELTVTLVRGAERWTVELSRLRPGGMLIDADLTGPGGLVHAAVALRGTARVTRAGEVISDTAALRAVALTTGFHADDGTFRALPAGRSGDLELLIHLEGLPGGGSLALGVEHPEITLDGERLPSAPMADASAPAWPGARLGAGVGGSGPSLPGPVPPLLPPPAPPSGQPGAPSPANAAGAPPLPGTPSPANAGPADALPPTPEPGNGGPAIPLPRSPAPAGASDAPLLPATPAPGNAAPAIPLPGTPAPTTSAPAPAGPVHGGTDTPGPTWFPAPTPPSPVPDGPQRESRRTRFARRASKIDPSGQGSTVRLRVQLRARALDDPRHLPRIALADRG